MRTVWIVELLERGVWVSTCWVALSRGEARRQQKQFSEENPNDKTRVVRYVPLVDGDTK